MSRDSYINADIVVSSNAIFTGRNSHPIPGAIALSGNKILAVGPENEINSLIGPNTIEEEAAEMVRKFADTRPDDPWILGFSWYHVFWKRKALPHRTTLDRLIPDRPVFLLNAECHGAWVNSKALEICNIDRNTPDPPFGEIERDENGEPTGYLYETAMALLTKSAYDIPASLQEKLLKSFLKKSAKLSVTAISDMQPLLGTNLGNLDVYRGFELSGDLTARVHVITTLDADLEYHRYLREKYNSDKLKFSGVKQFLDGVATTYTALMVDPYSDKPDTRGHPLIEPEVIKDYVVKADREGFRVRLHACGDGAVRLGLDCFEAARKANGIKGMRHTLEHIENVHSEDVGRFAQLGVIASMQPEHLAITDTFEDNPYPARLGTERIRLTWPVKTLMRRGAGIALRSDYPMVDLNPMQEVYRAVTRVHNDGEPVGGWNPDERLTMAETLGAYTLGSAYAAFRENDLGTLEEGKLADLIVIDRNLFNVPAERIRDAKVRLTVADGKVVFED